MPQAAANQNSQSDRGAVASMADFVANQGGAEAALRALADPEQAAPVKNDSSSRPPSSPSPQAEETSPSESDDQPELDAATLQALGLAQEDEPNPSGDDAEGDTSQPSADPVSVASTLGFDSADVSVEGQALKIKTKVDGEEVWVSPDELRKGYQLQKHFTAKNDQFLAEKQAWEQAKQQQEQQASALAGLANQVLVAEEEQLKAQYTKDWSKLRQEDPAEYSAQVAEYNQKLSDIQQRRQGLVQQAQQQAQQRYQEQMEQAKKLAETGLRQLSEIAGWKTEQDQTEGVQKLRGYLQTSVGLQPQEIDSILDSRTLISAEKARRYDELMAKVEDVRKKKVASAHKTPSGAAASPKEGGKKRSVQQAMAKLQKTGTVEDAGRAFLRMGILDVKR